MTPQLVRAPSGSWQLARVGWSALPVGRKPPDTEPALKPLQRAEPLDPLAGAWEKPILLEPWNYRRHALSIPRICATSRHRSWNYGKTRVRVPLANSIFLFGQVQKGPGLDAVAGDKPDDRRHGVWRGNCQAWRARNCCSAAGRR